MCTLIFVYWYICRCQHLRIYNNSHILTTDTYSYVHTFTPKRTFAYIYEHMCTDMYAHIRIHLQTFTCVNTLANADKYTIIHTFVYT